MQAREEQAHKVKASVGEGAPCVSMQPAVDVTAQDMSSSSDQSVLASERGRLTHDSAHALSGLDNNLEETLSEQGTTSWNFYSH